MSNEKLELYLRDKRRQTDYNLVDLSFGEIAEAFKRARPTPQCRVMKSLIMSALIGEYINPIRMRLSQVVGALSDVSYRDIIEGADAVYTISIFFNDHLRVRVEEDAPLRGWIFSELHPSTRKYLANRTLRVVAINK